jgi:hypothetical protein
MCRAYSTNVNGNECRQILVEKPGRRRPVGRPRRRCERNLKMDLREIGWGVMDWIYLTLDKEQWLAVVNAVMKLRIT